MFDPRPLVMMKGPPNLGLALIPILTPSLEHSLFTSMMMSVLVDGDDRSEDDDRIEVRMMIGALVTRDCSKRIGCVCVSLLPSIGHALI